MHANLEKKCKLLILNIKENKDLKLHSAKLLLRALSYSDISYISPDHL